MIDAIIYTCLKKNYLMQVTYQSPLVNKRVITGQVTDIDPVHNKYRVHLFDMNEKAFLYDDMGHPQSMTIAKNYVLSAAMVWWSFSKGDSVDCVDDDKAFINTYFYWYFGYDDLRQVEALSDFDAVELSAESTLHTNVLSVKIKNRMIPIMSKNYRYDVVKRTWVEKGLVVHYEQPLDKVFKVIPGSFKDVQSVTPYLKDTVDVDCEAWAFKQTKKRNKQVDSVIRSLKNRPIKAFFDRLTPKNMGRKDYYLCPISHRFDVEIQEVVLSALKHPLSVAMIKREVKSRYVDQFVQSAFLNDQSLLLLMKLEDMDAISHGDKVLVLDDNAMIDRAMDQLKGQSDEVSKAKVPGLIDYDEFYEAKNEGMRWWERLVLIETLLEQFEHKQAFHEIIRLQELRTYLMLNAPIIPINDTGYDADLSCEVMAFLKEKTQVKHKLKLKAYKQITEMLYMTDNTLRRRRLFELLKSNQTFALLKQLFPVMIAKDTRMFPLKANGFDQLVVFEPRHSVLKDFYYADKVCLLTESHINKAPGVNRETLKAAWVYDVAHKGIIEVIIEVGNKAVKVFNYQHPYINPPPVIHHHKAEKSAEHTVGSECEYIEKRIKHMDRECVVRTPFLKQKKALKKRLGKAVQVNTMFEETGLSKVLFSLALHDSTPQYTYDWVKMHPKLSTLFNGYGLEVFVDMNALVNLSDGRDALFKFINSHYQRRNSREAGYQLKDYLIREIGLDRSIFVEKNVRFDRIFPRYSNPSFRRLSYVFWSGEADAKCVVVSVDSQFTEKQIKSIEHGALQKGIQVFFVPKGMMKYSVDLVEILKTIGCLKVW